MKKFSNTPRYSRSNYNQHFDPFNHGINITMTKFRKGIQESFPPALGYLHQCLYGNKWHL